MVLPESKEKRIFNNLLGSLGNTPLVKQCFVVTVMFFVLLGGSCTSKNNSSIPKKFGSTMVSKKDGMVLVYVPAGEFSMGSDNGNSDETPVHKVTLDAFWIDQTEVTNAMYAKCVADGGMCPPPSAIRSEKRDDYYGVSEFDNYPVVYVNWSQASAYCSWAKRRLPTEAEWEKAARGTDGRTYPWGDESPNANLLNYKANVGDTTEGGKYPDGASIYGAYDMAGNVWEWVNDWYGKTYYKNSPASNPLGPDTDVYRVYRGGSWKGDDNSVRSGYRYGSGPSGTSDEIGFRCATGAN
jgi:formylglycine-generating enzyme required for sulfatase activity